MKSSTARFGKKLHKNAGFTLTEMMICALILVMVAATASLITSAAIDIKSNADFVSESRLLSTTVNTAISDVLRCAEDVQTVGASPDEEGYLPVDSFTNIRYGILSGSLTTAAIRNNTVMVCDAGGGAAPAVVLSPEVYGTIDMSGIQLAYNPELEAFRITYDLKDRLTKQTMTADPQYFKRIGN